MRKSLYPVVLGILLLVNLPQLSNVFAETPIIKHFGQPVLISKDTGNGYKKTESFILASPINSKNLVAAYIDVDPARGSNCRVSTSEDGGDSWSIPSQNQGYIPSPQGMVFSADPVLAVSGSTWYIICAATSMSVVDQGFASTIFYATSTDNGNTWQNLSVIASTNCNDVLTDCKGLDKPWIAVSGNNVYACWDTVDNEWFVDGWKGPTTWHVKFQRLLPTPGPVLELASGDSSNSPNGGRQVNLCNIVVNPNVNGNNGIVYIVWAHLRGNPGSPSSESIEMSRSFDNGQTVDGVQILTYFTRTPAIVGNSVQLCKSDFGCVEGYIDPSLGTHTGFDAVSSPSLAIDGQNNLGLTFQNYRAAQLTDVNFMKMSGCTTTSTCILGSVVNVANDGDITKDQFFPFIVYSSSKNAYHIVAMDKRNSPFNTNWEHFDYHCHADADCSVATNWQSIQVSADSTTNLDITPTDHIGDYYFPSDGSQLELVTNWIVGSEINHMRIYGDRTFDDTFSVKTGTFVKSVLSTQKANPNSDKNVGSWSPAPLWQQIGEVTPNDSNFITSPSGTSVQFEEYLSGLTDPQISTGHVINVRAKVSTGSGSAETAVLSLFQGATQIAASSAMTITRNSFSTLTFTLSNAQADAIIDYSSLSLRVTVSKANSEVVQVSWADFETPAPAAVDTVSDLKFTPKALILYTTDQTGEGSTDGYRFSIGISDGTHSRTIGIASDDGVSTPNTGRMFGTKILKVLSTGTPTLSAEADLVSFDPTGFKIKWTTNDAIAAKIHYIAIGGPDLTNSLVSSFQAITTTGPQQVPVGFQPDFVMLMHARSTTDTGSSSHAYLSYGFAMPSKRAAVALTSQDATKMQNSLTREIQRTDRALEGLVDNTGDIDGEADLSSMYSNGFNLNWNDALTNADTVYYLALKGGQYDIGSLTKTSLAAPVDQSQSFGNTDFQAKGIILSSINAPASNTVQNGARMTFGASDLFSSASSWTADSNAAKPSITARSETTTKAVRLATEAGAGSSSTINAEADLTELNINSFKLHWTANNNPTSQTQMVFAAFGTKPIRTISGYLFDDANGDGIDNSEPRLSNWNIKLFQNAVQVASMLTTSVGEFRFTGLSTGTYTITEDVQSHWVNTTPTSIGPIDLTGTNTDSINNKFGNKRNFDPVRVALLNGDASTAFDGRDMAIKGNYAYVLGSSGFEVIDISNPLNPTFVRAVRDNSSTFLNIPQSIAISGNYMYVGSWWNDRGIEVMNITDPTNPIHVRVIADDANLFLDNLADIAISGSYMYVASSEGVQILDISSPSNPIPMGKISDSANTALDAPIGITVSGNYAYVANSQTVQPGGKSGVEVLNVANPSSPTHAGKIIDDSTTNLTNPLRILVSGNYAYVTREFCSQCGETGIEVLNVANPSSPTHVRAVFDDSNMLLEANFPIAISGSYLYLGAGAPSDKGIEVLNISDPTNPIHAGKFVDTTDVWGGHRIIIVGNYAFVCGGGASGFGALEVLDITIP